MPCGGAWGAPRVQGGRATCVVPGTHHSTLLIRWDVAGVRRSEHFPCEEASQHVAASSQPVHCGVLRGHRRAPALVENLRTEGGEHTHTHLTYPDPGHPNSLHH